MAQSTKPVVFLDTNSINNPSLVTFFGKTNELKKNASRVDFVLPRIVYNELIEHKRREFEKSLLQLQRSPLLPRIVEPTINFEGISFEQIISELEAECPVDFSIASLSNKEAIFDNICSLAIRNEAPFEKGTDKGFKDACIAYTILEYADSHPEADSIFLISHDSRLKDFFDRGTRVKTLSTLDELHGYISEQDKELRIQANNPIRSASPKISKKLDDLVKGLCNSSSFNATHSCISAIKDSGGKITSEQGMALLKAAANNQQINWILIDEDVKGFILPIFNQYQELLDEHDYRAIVDAAGLPNDRVDEFGNVSLSRSEKETYDSFVDGLVSHIQSRDFGTSIATDYQEIEGELRDLLAKGEIDNRALTWEKLADCFIKNGSVIASSSSVSITPIKQFMRLMTSSSDRKRKAIMESIEARLEEVDEDFPF